MTYFDLPKDEMVGYSPLGFVNKIFKPAIKGEQGSDDEKMAAVLNSKNKNKFLEIFENGHPVRYSYKRIMEMYYATIYALAINKKGSIKYDIIASDSPDIIFANEVDANDRVAVEIYEAFNFEDRDIRKIVDIKSEVGKIYNKKGNKNYQINSRLVIINRVNSTPNGFNVSEYRRELNKYFWNFSHIILCLFRQRENDFNFFCVYPEKMCNAKIDFVLGEDDKFWY
jgi:hypothetical protein